MVPKVRVELTRPCGQRILSPPRLPFRHFGTWLQPGRPESIVASGVPTPSASATPCHAGIRWRLAQLPRRIGRTQPTCRSLVRRHPDRRGRSCVRHDLPQHVRKHEMIAVASHAVAGRPHHVFWLAAANWRDDKLVALFCQLSGQQSSRASLGTTASPADRRQHEKQPSNRPRHAAIVTMRLHRKRVPAGQAVGHSRVREPGASLRPS